jgi:uncharacterized tellurite resistance protein B-like protein
MIGRFAVLAGRIRQDLAEIERIVLRVERAVDAAHQGGIHPDLCVDSAALNLHDCYSGIERLFEQVASTVDQSVPSTRDWHRDLLRQMTVAVPGLRPQVVSSDTATGLDEYRRFRHVVRNVYAFNLDPERVAQLAADLRPAVARASGELQAFAAFLEGVASEG